MSSTQRESLSRLIGVAMLPLTIVGLVVGVLASWAGIDDLAWWAWTVPAVIVGVRLAWQIVRDLLDREAGVDVIALLAIAGALAVGESLDAAIIAVMLATGEALEDYAEGRAKRELTALLERAPQQVRRYVGSDLEIVPVAAVAPGDRVLVRPGEVVPVDGLVTGQPAVLDESALTGESRPITRAPGDAVASGVVNAGGPFDLTATADAEASTMNVAAATRPGAGRVPGRIQTIAVLAVTAVLIAGAAWVIDHQTAQGGFTEIEIAGAARPLRVGEAPPAFTATTLDGAEVSLADYAGKTVILVDDGLATGSTMRAAVIAARQQHPARVIVAVPVGAPETCAGLAREADDVVCVRTPAPFVAVGLWYRDFTPTTDSEVRALLEKEP